MTISCGLNEAKTAGVPSLQGRMKSIKSQNFYEILGVSRYASPEEIRRAYEICKNTFTDDSLATYSLFSDDENHEIFALISRAFETLANPKLRREYDTFLSNLEGESGGSSAEEEALVAGAMGMQTAGGSPPPRAKSPAPVMPPAQPAPQAAEPTTGPTLVPKAAPDPRLEKFIQSVSAFNGPILRKIRTLRGISLEDLAQFTKIRKTYLECLEEENFTLLPAPIYIKGFIIIVSNALELPSQKVAEDYMAQYRLKNRN